jgi:dienelactone hydrolase
MKRIAIKLAGVIILVLVIGQATTYAKIIGKTVEYKVDGTLMKSYLVYDSSIKNKKPGILVVDEWWGLTDYGRNRARMLAELGYTALAVDMYGEGKQVDNPADAAAMSSGIMKNFDVARSRFIAAEDLLKRQPSVDTTRIAAIGFCFGGGVILNMVRQATDLKGVVSFHGSLGAVKPANPVGIKAKILILQGGADTLVTPDKVEEFKKEMIAAGADYRVIVYPGATHSFSNPHATDLGKKFKLPIVYNKKADKASWQAMKTFLNEILK